MLMPKKNRVAIYEYLFKEGVMVAKKDFIAKHPELENIPNLHVIKTMQVSFILKFYYFIEILCETKYSIVSTLIFYSC